MDLYAKRTEKLVRHEIVAPGQKVFPTASRFSSYNIPVNGIYPGRYVIGRHDKINMVPPNMNPYEK